MSSRDNYKQNRARNKQNRGQKNKGMLHAPSDNKPLCATRSLSDEFSAEECTFGEKCKFEHDLRKYLHGKHPDLKTFSGECPVFDKHGFCPSGWKCRFVDSHSKEIEREDLDGKKELVLIIDHERFNADKYATKEDMGLHNVLNKAIKMQLGRRNVSLDKSEEYIKWLNEVWQAEEDSRARAYTLKHAGPGSVGDVEEAKDGTEKQATLPKADDVIKTVDEPGNKPLKHEEDASAKAEDALEEGKAGAVIKDEGDVTAKVEDPTQAEGNVVAKVEDTPVEIKGKPPVKAEDALDEGKANVVIKEEGDAVAQVQQDAPLGAEGETDAATKDEHGAAKAEEEAPVKVEGQTLAVKGQTSAIEGRAPTVEGDAAGVEVDAASKTELGNLDDKTSKVDLEDHRAAYIEPPFRASEKRRLYYGPETPILAPLTTQGNLPFRRLCVKLGAQLTFSEMALGLPLVQGANPEWALMKAHESEITPPTVSSKAGDIVPGYDNSKDVKFGVQIAAGKPWIAFKTTEAIAKYCPHVRAIDLNSGCPIDLVCKSGAGSALMDQTSKLEKILRGMNALSGEIPITLKIRTGTRDKVPNADSVVKRMLFGGRNAVDAGLGPTGIAAITLHGRSRQQRYTKSADWEYISDIAALIRKINKTNGELADTASEPDPRDLANGGKVLFVGNGDILSHVDYQEHIDHDLVDCAMIGRGALLKPWIFEEIAAGQYLDKSATERLGYVEDFVRYGLDTWGADERGVQTTRRFLLEWISFSHRYVPIGLLERLPPKMNERPPPFRGRDEMETLLASDQYADWLKISEIYLGRAERNFRFVPKHKSNSYEAEG
jgi:tRNA-dihydrouridine synthase 3